MTVYSHPPEDGRGGVALPDHLRDVRDRVGLVVPEDATTQSGDSVLGIVEKLALVHDIGKATTWFQQYVLDDVSPRHERLRYHAPLGAFAAYYVLRETNYSTETCLAGFVAVAKHHGQLPHVARYVAERTSDNADEKKVVAVLKQAINIHDNARDLAAEIFQEATGDAGAWTSFATELTEDDELFEEIADPVMGLESARDDPFSDEFYGLALELWGTLVLADKTSAAGAPDDLCAYEPTKPSMDDLDEHVAALEAESDAALDGSRNERLNYFRSQAREDVLGSVDEFAASDDNVATITLPTGMGKTLTGLSAALELRDAVDGERVVYALPFTSIIDQVVAKAKDIFSTSGTDGLLAVHHHLSDTRIETADGTDDEDADLSDDVAGMLGESWRAGLTVSTFVQLFESLAGPRNTQSMKLPALRESVIVLDEPQSLPLNWWKLVPRLVEILTEQYGATIIAMTATQPELFDEPTQLVDDVDDYFQEAERVQYHLHDSFETYLDNGDADEALSYEAAADEIAQAENADNSTLAICNTIDSARELTGEVTDRFETVDLAEIYFDKLSDGNASAGLEPERGVVEVVKDTAETPFVHLSTRLRPTDRLALVRCIKQLRERGMPVVAVTTQLVEAGVDVSFENVYRDLAPVDSIVQAAGRCNRSFERDRGDVTVWWLAPPEDREQTPAVAVYDWGESLTPVTAAALDNVRDEDEAVLDGPTVSREAVTEYYDVLDQEKNVGKAEYVGWVDSADAASLATQSLIDTPRSIDVLVCLSEDDQELVDELERAYENYEYERTSELLDETKPLRVSIPIYDSDSPEAKAVTDLPPLADHDEDSDLRVLRANATQYDDYFDATTGFVVPDAGVDHRFL